jgi:hypothetical protein
VVAPLVKIGITAALFAAQMALGALRKIEGPRLDSTKVTLAEYGTHLTDFYGIRRIEGCPMVWADDLREEKKKSKGKAGKATEYKYYGDWAVAVAGHEIEAIRRVWFDNHLVYQLGDIGPISLGSFTGQILTGAAGRVLKLSHGKNMRFYLGTDDQVPDPLIEAWFEDHDDFGADCCSAMRGTAYIVFQDIPLEKFGNRIPTVTVEAVAVKTPAYLSSEVEGDPPGLGGLSNFVYSPDFSKFFVADVSGPPTPFAIWDVPTRTELYQGQLGAGLSAAGGIGIDNDGRIYGANGNSIFRYGSTGGAATEIETTPTNNAGVMLTRDGEGNQYIGTLASGVTATYFGPLEPFALTAFDAGTYTIVFYCEDGHGDIWALGRGGAGTTTIHFHRIVNYSGRTLSDDHQVITVVAASTNTPPLYAVHSLDNGSFLVYWNNTRLYVIDDTSFAITHTEIIGSGISGTKQRFINHPPGDPTIWLGEDEISLATAETLRTIAYTDWTDVSIPSGNHGVYDPINHAILIKSVDGVAWLYLDRIGSQGPTLGYVVETEAARVGLEVDASALDQTIEGYSVTQGPVKDRIAPLMDLHDSILRPHGFDIYGLKQGTVSLGTILVEDFVRQGDDPRYEIEEAQATDLPAIIELKWADSTSDQQTNSVPIPRHLGTTDSSRVQPIDMSTYVGEPTEMVQLGERFLRTQWNRRAVVRNGITAKYLAVEPGDVYDLNLDGVVWTAYAEKLTFSALTPDIRVEWRRTFASLNSLGSGSGAGMTGRTPDAIIVPGPTKGFVLDIPLPYDADNSVNPQLYYGAGSYSISWPGAAILEGDLDGDDYVEWKSVPASEKATWGFASDALPTANPNLWDRGNTLTVNVYGTLTSSTETAINADPTINLAALRNPTTGDTELINFATATLTGTNGSANVYELTGLLRGRRGTEWAMDHEIGDEFVLIEDLMPVSQGLSEVGVDQFFKAQSYGRDPDTAQVIQVDFAGNSLKPYAPARLKVVYDGTDLDCEIIRRTRVGGTWSGGSTIPLSENSEAYEVDVYVSSVFKRTITVTGTNLFTYTAAMAAADGITLPTQPTFEVYQMSDAVGRGFALAA